MKVHHLVTYLSRIPEDSAQKTEIFWACIKIKQAIKGSEIKGYFDISIDGKMLRFDEKNIPILIDHYLNKVSREICKLYAMEIDLVPIPGHSVTSIADTTFRNLGFCSTIAEKSDGKIRALHCLRWNEEQEPQRGTTGHRDWRSRYAPMRVDRKPDRPVVLFDDVLTSGSTLIAAKKRLEECGATVLGAFVIAKATQDEPPSIEWRSIEVSAFDPASLFDEIDDSML